MNYYIDIGQNFDGFESKLVIFETITRLEKPLTSMDNRYIVSIRRCEMKEETLVLVNGNDQSYLMGLPRLVMMEKEINDVALEHIRENTQLHFTPTHWGGYEVQPINSQQIVKLFLTYNFKTRYYNNADLKNTILLKSDHHIGFDVEDICYDCVKHNHIHVGNLKPGDRLAC